MTLSAKPETICLRLDLPRAMAFELSAAPEDVSSRHAVEKVIQDNFYLLSLPAYVAKGVGTVEAGHIFILTDKAAPALSEFKRLLRCFPASLAAHGQMDLLPHIHLGWFDPQAEIWRTWYPQTTRPFWTLIAAPDEVAAIMEKGRALA